MRVTSLGFAVVRQILPRAPPSPPAVRVIEYADQPSDERLSAAVLYTSVTLLTLTSVYGVAYLSCV